MENSKISILIIEDNPSDAELVKLELKKSGFVQMDHYLNIASYRSLFVHGKYDVILCDYNLGEKLGIEILKDVRNSDKTIPFIFVSGAIGEERAVEVLRLGATDYVMKNNLRKLPLVIDRALKEVIAKKHEEVAQQAILESKRRYKSLIEHMNEALLFSDGNGKILFVNHQFCTMTGYSSEELIGAMGYELLTPKTIREELKKKVASREKGVSEIYEMEMLRKDEQIILVRNSASPIVEEGKFIGVMSMLSDITIEKKQERFLQSIHNSLGVATGSKYFSELTDFLQKNFRVKVALIASYNSVENSAETISFTVNGEQVPNIKYCLENTPCANIIEKKVCGYPRNIQQLFPLDQHLAALNAQSYVGVPLVDDKKQPIGLIVILDSEPMEDVEEIKQLMAMLAVRASSELQRSVASKSLMESELKYRNVVEDQTELIFRWKPDGRIVFANKSFLNFNKLSEEEILKKTITDLVPPDEMHRFRNKIAQLNFKNAVITDSHHAVHPVWGEFWHEWTDRAFFEENGNIVEYQSIGRDVTKKKLALLELEESEKFKESILSALTASIAVIDGKGKIISVNKNWQLFSENNNGNPLCTDMGVNYLEVCKNSAEKGDEIAEKVFAGISDVISGQTVKFELEYPCNSETEFRWFHMIVTPFSGLSGGVVISHYDISEKKIQEQKINNALRELENIDRIHDAIKNGYSLDAISELILNSFRDIHGELTGRVYFLDKKSIKLELKYELLKENVLSKIEKKLGLNMGTVIPEISEGTYFGKIIRENKQLFFDDKISITEFVKSHSTNLVVKKLASWAVDLIPINSVGIMPLSIDGEVFGLITVTSALKISVETQKSFIRLAEQSADAIAKKKAEDKLVERENYLSALIDSIPDMLFRLNKDGIIIDYKSNDGSDARAGQGGSLVGHSFLKLLPKHAIELHQNCVKEALRTGKSVSYDFEIQILGDKPKYYETRIKSNSLDELVLIVRDITIRKNQDQLLVEKENKLNEAQKIAMVGSWHLDVLNDVLEWSDEACRIFGVEPGTKLNLEKFLSFVHPMDRGYVNAEWAAALEGKNYNIEHRIIVDGKTKWVREIASLERNMDGEVIGGLGTVQDITSMKIAEKELLYREELLSFSHKLAKIGYYTWNQNTDQLWWSKELFEIGGLDYRNSSATHDLFLSLVHEGDKDRIIEFVKPFLIKPRSFQLDYRIITPAGVEKYLRETVEVRKNELGEKIFVGVIQDITEVKDFESALIKREKQIKKTHKLNTQIIETADQFFYVYKIDEEEKNKSRVTFASPQVKDVFGISTEEFLNNQDLWRDSIHPEDMIRLQIDKNKIYLTKEPVTLEYRIKNRETGNYFWVEDYARPLLDETGKVVELYGSVKNIDNRKKSEEELLQREKLLKEAQHIAKLGSWEWDLKSNKVQLNEEMYQILEISPENYGGYLNDLLKFISPESIPRFKEAISNAYEHYKSEDVELQIVTAKGNERRLLLRGSEQREIKNHSIIARGTLLDITEIWKSHNALFETEEKFKKIFESITDVYYQADANGIYTMVSPSCLSMLEYTQEELIGKPLSELYEFPEKRSEVLKLLKQEGFLSNIENSLITKSGARIYVSGSISVLLDKEGSQIGVQGIDRNISEKRLNEIEREKLLLELTNKYNQLMQFNYIVSHNLRSPITNLLGLSNMFDGEMTENERIKIVTHIKNSALAMDGLVKDLNMILATRTAINENKEEVRLTKIFETIKNNLRTQIQESKAILITDIASDNDQLFTIKSYLQSILYNLVSNSLKYCSNERAPVIIISCEKNNSNTTIQIRDNGNGMDLEKYGKQLFGLYKRFDLSKEGRGLGLHMTKTQIEALGGEVKVESELGKGTTFTIILPI